MTGHATHPHINPPSTPAGTVGRHVIVGLILGVLGLAALFGIGDEITDGSRGAARFDHAVLMWMHGRQTPDFTEAATFLAWMGSPTVIVSLALIGTLAGFVDRKLRGAAWTFPVAAAGAGILIQVAKLTVHRARPDLFVPLLKEHGFSFPSGHSLIAVVIYGLIGYFALGFTHRLASRAAIVAASALVILAIGLSRIYVGVHYPTDVIAGWSAGIPWLVVCIGLHEQMSRRWGRYGQPVLEKAPKLSNAIEQPGKTKAHPSK